MSKLAQFLLVSPLATFLLYAVYQSLRRSQEATMRPGITARTRNHLFVLGVGYLALLLAAVLVIAVMVH